MAVSDSEKDVVSSSSTQTSATESSRLREWGKRKLLVTRKRGEAGKARVKRARQASQQRVQLPDQSSTETDNSDDDDKANGFQKNNDDLDATKAVMKDMKGVGQQMTDQVLNITSGQITKITKQADSPGDVVLWGLNVAKAMFQEMLDGLVSSKSEEQPSTMLTKEDCAKDPIGGLCDPAKRSPDQTIVFKTRLRDTIAIIDATLCKPPRDHTCSRDCRSIRAQMCNEFTPCINPTCRIWHDAEAHLEKCTNEQCEFRTRIKLQETMHLIEHKQQEIDDTRDALVNANTTCSTTLLSPSSKERTNAGNSEAFKLMDSLERDLMTFNHKQMDLIDIKLQHWDALNDIGIDSSSDEIDGFPNFASHYAAQTHRHKPTGK